MVLFPGPELGLKEMRLALDLFGLGQVHVNFQMPANYLFSHA